MQVPRFGALSLRANGDKAYVSFERNESNDRRVNLGYAKAAESDLAVFDPALKDRLQDDNPEVVAEARAELFSRVRQCLREAQPRNAEDALSLSKMQRALYGKRELALDPESEPDEIRTGFQLGTPVLTRELKELKKLSREELESRLMWNYGGTGYGIATVGNMLAQAFAPPPRSRMEDWPSVVAVSGPPRKYTKEELAKLVWFSDRMTASYDRMFRYRKGANLICVDKNRPDSWMRKRQTWEFGPMYSRTLDAAIGTFVYD